MRKVRQAIVLVDAYRRSSRRRNSAGRYRVGAKTEKEAEELVRKTIGFGSVKFYYWEHEDAPTKKVAYKEVVRDFIYEPAKHVCANHKEVNSNESKSIR